MIYQKPYCIFWALTVLWKRDNKALPVCRFTGLFSDYTRFSLGKVSHALCAIYPEIKPYYLRSAAQSDLTVKAWSSCQSYRLLCVQPARSQTCRWGKYEFGLYSYWRGNKSFVTELTKLQNVGVNRLLQRKPFLWKRKRFQVIEGVIPGGGCEQLIRPAEV